MYYPNAENALQLHQVRLQKSLQAGQRIERLRDLAESTCDSERIKYLILKLSDLSIVKQMLASSRPISSRVCLQCEQTACYSL